MARRFVAGEKLDEAVAAARELNEKDLMVSLDHLGENVFNEADAARATEEYIAILEAIHLNKLNANISVKLTALGLDIGNEICLNNMRRILQKAQDLGNTVNIDMEGSEYTDRTINIFHQLHQEFDNVGTVIQAYLYRSEADMRKLAEEGATIRLCKGAYKEPAEIAFPKKEDVDANYIKLSEIFLDPANVNKGAYLKSATHDPDMIEATKKIARQNNISPQQYEFQMLYGIRTTTQLELVKEGYQVRIYIPYGTEWYPYFMRRLAERPANLWFIFRNLFTR
jgi:proline dehydrogenase